MTTRRTILGAAFALPLAGRAKAARQVDPALAAIKRLNAALVVFGDAINPADEVVAMQQGRSVTPADEAAYDSASDALEEALEAMAETVPTSVQGIRAMLNYLLDHGNICEIATEAALESILESPVLAEGVGA